MVAGPFANMTVIKHAMSRIKNISGMGARRLMVTTQNFVQLMGPSWSKWATEAKPILLHVPQVIVQVLVPALSGLSGHVKHSNSGLSVQTPSPCPGSSSSSHRVNVTPMQGGRFPLPVEHEVVDSVNNGDRHCEVINLVDDEENEGEMRARSVELWDLEVIELSDGSEN